MSGGVRSEVVRRIGDLSLRLDTDEEAVVAPVLGKWDWTSLCFSQTEIEEALYHMMPISSAEPRACEVTIRPRKVSHLK